jgi:hypothetical protein
LARSLINLSQSRSEMRTDNFIIILFIVPSLDDLGYNFPALGSHLEIEVRNRLQCPNVASL